MSRPIIETLASAAFLAMAACGGGPPPAPAGPSGPAPLTPLDASDRLYSDNGEGIVDSVRIVVRDQGELRDEWSRATRHQTSPAPPPDIDFEEHMVVVVGAGRMTPQDRIRVDSVGIRELPDAMGNPRRVLVVRVRTIRGCQQLNLDAYPVEIVRVPYFDGPVRFTGRTEQDPNCLTALAPHGSAAPPPGAGPVPGSPSATRDGIRPPFARSGHPPRAGTVHPRSAPRRF